MNSTKLLFYLIILLFSNVILASNSPVKFAYVQGSVNYTLAGTNHQAIMGNELPKKSVLKLKKNSQVILKDSKNRYCILETLEIDKTFDFSQLESIFMGQQNKGLMKSVIDFMAKELKSEHYNARDYAANNLKKKGGVTRDGCTYPLMLYPGSNQHVSEYEILFKWSKELNEEDYILEVYFGDEYNGEVVKTIFTAQVSDTFCAVPVSAFKEDYTGKTLNWVVYPKTFRRNCARYYLVLISQEDRKEIIDKIDDGLKKTKNEEDRLSQRAFLLESNGLIKDSELVYRELISKYDKKTYTDLMNLFHMRNGLFEE
jgi:hypothetical protein